ncbi:hypothetical protein [Massilia yuzhufengensis]|nr:hypothetical protein [Massilia yuzhufengensis]
MDIQDQDSAAGSGGAPRNPGRRRFASAGAAASGVILTLASAPGMATECRAPSGAMSGNVSRPGAKNVMCAGRSPGYWKNWATYWPSGCYAATAGRRQATTFASVFPFGWTSLYQTGTMMQVLTCNDASLDRHNLGAHLVAAYLNVKSQKISFLTVERLKSIWHDLYTYGYYTPVAGTRWYAKDVAEYLQRTET